MRHDGQGALQAQRDYVRLGARSRSRALSLRASSLALPDTCARRAVGVVRVETGLFVCLCVRVCVHTRTTLHTRTHALTHAFTRAADIGVSSQDRH